jgi:hypothetical protein
LKSLKPLIAISGKHFHTIPIQKHQTAINNSTFPPHLAVGLLCFKEEVCKRAQKELKILTATQIKAVIVSKMPMKKAVLEKQLKKLKKQIKAMYIKMTNDNQPIAFV